jgi:hypothetical protein
MNHAIRGGPGFAVTRFMLSTSRLAVTLSTLLGLAAIAACSAAPAPAPTDESDVTTKKPTKPAGDTTKTTDPTDPAKPPTTPTADACGTKGTFDACFECCYQKNPTESDKADAVFLACVCEAPGACKTECGDSLCGTDPNKAPSAACETCLTTNGAACDEKAKTACDASPGCKEVDDCVASQCAPLDGK